MSAPSWLTGKADAASLAALVEQLGTQIDVATVDEPALEPRLAEHATTPAERLPRVIAGVLRRLGDDYAAIPPSYARIDCSARQWQALIEVLMSIKANEPLPENLLQNQSENDDLDN